jgi:hypothetical protein
MAFLVPVILQLIRMVMPAQPSQWIALEFCSSTFTVEAAAPGIAAWFARLLDLATTWFARLFAGFKKDNAASYNGCMGPALQTTWHQNLCRA